MADGGLSCRRLCVRQGSRPSPPPKTSSSWLFSRTWKMSVFCELESVFRDQASSLCTAQAGFPGEIRTFRLRSKPEFSLDACTHSWRLPILRKSSITIRRHPSDVWKTCRQSIATAATTPPSTQPEIRLIKTWHVAVKLNRLTCLSPPDRQACRGWRHTHALPADP